MQIAPDNTSKDEQLTVKILSPKGVLWDGLATMVSSENSQGPFDLLPNHARFISLIKEKQIHIAGNKEKISFSCKTAVVRLVNNSVTVYVDIAQ